MTWQVGASCRPECLAVHAGAVHFGLISSAQLYVLFWTSPKEYSLYCSKLSQYVWVLVVLT